MKKKGEIGTIIALGSLLVISVVSLVSSFFIKKTQTTKTKAASCSQVNNVSYSPSSISAGQTFTCLASTDGTSPRTMACGISKNGGWPQNMLSGSCSGSSCSFQVKMDDNIDSSASYELVAFDFRSDCGPSTGKRISLNVSGVNPQPTQADCDPECCGKPDGYIYKQDLKLKCDPNYKGGRYVIMEGICQGGKKAEKPGCATCRSCQSGDGDQPVSGSDLAVNECTGGCGQTGGVCSNLPDCPTNISPAIVRNCNDTSFSCPAGYSSCKKDGAIWCYGGGGSGSSGGSAGEGLGRTPPIEPTNPNLTECEENGGTCANKCSEIGENMIQNDDLSSSCGTHMKCCFSSRQCSYNNNLISVGSRRCFGNTAVYCPSSLTPTVTQCSGDKICRDGTCVEQEALKEVGTSSANTNEPGTAGGPCKNPSLVYSGGRGGYFGGECYGGLVCYRNKPSEIGICVNPTPMPSPTPFCQNLNIPKIHTGITVGLANAKGEGHSISIDDIVNAYIQWKIRSRLEDVKNLKDLSEKLTQFITEQIIEGITTALTNLAVNMAEKELIFIRINDWLIPTPLYPLALESVVLAVKVNQSGIALNLANKVATNFVNLVINSICVNEN